MAWIGSNLKYHLIPAPCHGQGLIALELFSFESTGQGRQRGPSLMEAEHLPWKHWKHPPQLCWAIPGKAEGKVG